MPDVQIVEVGPRDGLQYESVTVSPQDRERFIRMLADAGLRRIEAGSFVHPKWVPQMAGTTELAKAFVASPMEGVELSYLVPNDKGMEHAIAAGVGEVAVFIASTEAFSKKNLNMTIEASLQAVAEVMMMAREHRMKVRGYLSTIFRDIGEEPTTAPVTNPRQVAKLTKRLLEMGCYEVSLGDTTGVGTPDATRKLMEALKAKGIELAKVAMHFHDTHGCALENMQVAYDAGIRVFDAAADGLGGCPYAGPGASGNVATDKVVRYFTEQRVNTGVDIKVLGEAIEFIRAIISQSTTI